MWPESLEIQMSLTLLRWRFPGGECIGFFGRRWSCRGGCL